MGVRSMKPEMATAGNAAPHRTTGNKADGAWNRGVIDCAGLPALLEGPASVLYG